MYRSQRVLLEGCAHERVLVHKGLGEVSRRVESLPPVVQENTKYKERRESTSEILNSFKLVQLYPTRTTVF